MGFWAWIKGTGEKIELATMLVYAKDAIKLADPTRFAEVLQAHGLPQPDPTETFMLLAYSVAALVIRQDKVRNNPHFRELFLAVYDHLVSETLTEQFGSDPHHERFREYIELGLFRKVDTQDPESMSQAEQKAFLERTMRVITPHLFHSLDYGASGASFVSVAYFNYLTHITKHLIENKGP